MNLIVFESGRLTFGIFIVISFMILSADCKAATVIVAKGEVVDDDDDLERRVDPTLEDIKQAPPEVWHSTTVRKSYNNLKREAFNQYKASHYDEAIRLTEESLKAVGEDELKKAEALGNAGALYRLKGDEAKGQKLLAEARAIRAKHGMNGVPLGLQTEASFDLVGQRKSKTGVGQPQESVQMMDPLSISDFNRDGKCNEKDEALFNRALGQQVKPGVEAYVVQADFDLDRWVTEKDRDAFRQLCSQARK